MTILFLTNKNETINDLSLITKYLNDHGVEFSRWSASKELNDQSTQEEILAAYEHELKPFMDKKGFKTADVINVHPKTENIEAIRQKFLKEHTHSEDEVRFFVDGEGKFWFNFGEKDVVCLTCVRGDFLSVPSGFKHWFDLAPKYHVKAIRIFFTMEGWVANYTESGIDEKYNK